MADMDATLEALKKSRVLSGLPEQDLQEIACLGVLERYRQAEVILFEGEPGEDLFLLVSGKVGVSARLGGRSRKLAVLGIGDVFGEVALLKDKKRSATVVALEDVQVSRIPAGALEVVLEYFPLVRAKLEELGISRMLESMTKDLELGE